MANLKLVCVWIGIFIVSIECSLFLPSISHYGVTTGQSGCTSLKILSKTEGVIAYQSNNTVGHVCWVIKLPQIQYVTIRASYLHIEQQKSSYCSNYLLIQGNSQYNGALSNVNARVWCGNSLPGVAVFRTNRVLIKLVVDELLDSAPMFTLNYEVDDICAMHQEIQSYTFITSVGYPNSVQSDCAWTITLDPDAGTLPLEFELTDCQLLIDSWIHIYDGLNNSSQLLWSSNCIDVSQRTLGDSLGSVTTTGPHMFVQFVSDHFLPFKGFNATVKAKGYCLPGTFSCGDQESCYTAEEKCNGNRDCPSGFDELKCGDCAEGLFNCGDGNCYSAQQYCDGKAHCSNRADEAHCKHCAPGAFQCRTNKNCIFERWTCDGTPDCLDESDEEGCVYTASRQVVTAAIVGSLVCGLLLAVALGCSCKLYTLRSATRNRRTRQVVPTPLGRIARQLLQREAPPSYSMTVDGVDSDSPDSSLRRSSGSRQRRRGNRERRSRRRNRNRDPQIRRARPDVVPGPPRGDAAEPTREQSDSRTDNVVQAPPSVTFPPPPPPPVIPTSAPEPPPLPQRNAPSTTTSSTTNPPQTSEGSSSPEPQSAGDVNPPEAEQAPPLPKKRRIRPVLVEAPCNDQMVEDIPNCVYPNPPAYSDITDARSTSEDEPPTDGFQENAILEERSHQSRNLLQRLVYRLSPNKSPGFWRSLFGRSHSYRPFHELEQQADSVSAESDSVLSMSIMTSVTVNSPPSTSRVSPPYPSEPAGSKIPSPHSHPPLVDLTQSDDEADTFDHQLPHPSNFRHPFEMTNIQRREATSYRNSHSSSASSLAFRIGMSAQSDDSAFNMQTSQS